MNEPNNNQHGENNEEIIEEGQGKQDGQEESLLTEDGEATEVAASSSDEETEDDSRQSRESTETVKEENWIDPRFKTVDELKNYTRSLEDQLYQRQNVSQNQPAPQPKTLSREEFAERIKRGETIEAIQDAVRPELDMVLKETKQIRLQNNLNSLAARNPDFQELRPIMMDLANQYSGFIKANNLEYAPETLDWLLVAARGLKSQQKIKETEVKASKKGERSALKKSKLQFEGGSTSKGVVKKPFRDLSLEEMERKLRRGEA